MATKKPKNLTMEEQITVLTLAKEGVGCTTIAQKLGRNESTISRFIVRMTDSSELAKATLKAGAALLAKRVIAKADVKESLDVLSRPDIGVLAPPVGKGSGLPGFGIQVSVGIASCGTVVRVGVTDGQEQEQSALQEGSIIETARQIEGVSQGKG